MKSPDKDIDSALKAALKRKFDDFEAEATKASEDVIFSKQRVPYWQSAGGRTLVAVGLVIFLFFLPFLYYSVSNVKEKATVSAVKKDSFHSPAILKKQDTVIDSQVDGVKLAVKENKLNQLAASTNNVINLKVATKTEKAALSVGSLAKAVKAVQTVKIYENANNGFLPSNRLEERPMLLSARIPEGNLSPLNYLEQNKSLSLEYKGLSTPYDLEIIGKRPYLEYHFQPTLRIAYHTNTLERKYSKADKETKDFAFILNVIPLNTVQVLTVKSSPGVIYQNVSVPSEILLNRLGYKFTAGLAKGAFQFLFSYGQLNQLFKYEIASDEFVLKKDGNDYTFVPKGVQYGQDNKLKFVGLGLKRHGVIKNESVFQNYFGDVGIEFSRELKTNSNVLWGNLAIGKQVVLSKNAQLNIGPYLEYSFTKIVNPDTKFQIQPYQIGLSIGFTYLKK